MFARETASKYFDLDMKAALLDGKFVLHEGDESATQNVAARLERLLGNRDNHERLFGALRAAEVACLPESFPWVRHHLYSNMNPLLGPHDLIKDVAFAAAAALGRRDLPRFNDDDEFAGGVPVSELPEAMGRPHLHDIEHVLKRLHEEKYSDPKALEPVRAYLLDALRFSDDDNGRTFDAQWPAFQALAHHGPAGRAALHEVPGLEHCRNSIQNDAIFFMRLLEGKASFAAYLIQKSSEEVLELLGNPDARALAHLEQVAARAYLLDAKSARPALEQAMRLRYRWRGGHFAEEDPALVNMPRLWALYGKPAHGLLRELSEAIDPLGEYEASHTSHELDFRGSAPGPDHASEGKWTAPDEAQARKAMNDMVHMFNLLGYKTQPVQ